MAEFEPSSNEKWDAQWNIFKRRLEELYPLCEQCHSKVKRRIREIDSKLLPRVINFWHRVRPSAWFQSNVSRSTLPSHQSPVHLEIEFPKSVQWLLRLSSSLCLCVAILQPFFIIIVAYHCFVFCDDSVEETTIVSRLLRQIQSSKTFPNRSSWCPTLVHLSTQLTTSHLGQFWFALLGLVVQLILIYQHCTLHPREYHSSRKHRSNKTTRSYNPTRLLIDLVFLILMCHTLLSLIPKVFGNQNKLSNKASPSFLTSDVSGYAILAIVVTPVVLGAVWGGLIRWIRYCSSDWAMQKRVMTNHWSTAYSPDCGTSSMISSDVGSTLYSPLTTESLTSSASFRLPNEWDNNPIPEFASAWGPSESKSLFSFRPSLLGPLNTSPSFVPPMSYPGGMAKNSVACSSRLIDCRSYINHRIRNEDDDDDKSSDSFVTSVSRARRPIFKNESPDSIKSYVEGRRSHDGSRKHSRRRRRGGGLLRVCLSFLFGKVDTWRDVVNEVLSLINALLIAFVVFGMVRFFIRFVHLF